MKRPVFGARTNVRSVVAGELVGAGAAGGLLAVGAPLAAAVAGGAVIGVLICVLTIAGLPLWRWVGRLAGWLIHREHRLQVRERSMSIATVPHWA